MMSQGLSNPMAKLSAAVRAAMLLSILRQYDQRSIVLRCREMRSLTPIQLFFSDSWDSGVGRDKVLCRGVALGFLDNCLKKTQVTYLLNISAEDCSSQLRGH